MEGWEELKVVGYNTKNQLIMNKIKLMGLRYKQNKKQLLIGN